MPVSDPDEACVRLRVALDFRTFQWRFPLNLKLNVHNPGLPIPQDYVGKLLGYVNTALLPLVPIMDVISALLKLIDIIEALKNFDFKSVVRLLREYLEIVDAIKGVLPGIWVPLFLRDAIWVLILLVHSVRADVEAIIKSQSRIDIGGAKADLIGSADLVSALDCSSVNLDFELDGYVQATGSPLNRLVLLYNRLAKLAKLPQIPDMNIQGGDTIGILIQLDKIILQLFAIYTKLPDPDPMPEGTATTMAEVEEDLRNLQARVDAEAEEDIT